jgi:manganese-dependent inorganic pyrophosphatase
MFEEAIAVKKSQRWGLVCCSIILLAAVGLGGFFLGKSVAAQHYQEEKELDILLNRSDLEGLGEIKGTIYVTGHKNPDSDTVCSSIAYAALLQKLGYDATPVVLGEINHESAYILEAAGLETPEQLEDASGLNMILVDHSEYIQSADGLTDANIIGIIDHHGVGTVTTGNQLVYDARPLGSTATIIWIRYRNYGVVPDKQTACTLMGALLSDTSNLQSDTTTAADREALEALSKMAGISDTDAFYQEMFKASLSYEGMSDEEIFFSDYKEYEAGGKKFSIACINAYDEDTAKELAERMKPIVPATLPSTGMDMAFAQISIFHDDISITYLVPSDQTAGEVLEAAFGDSAVFDGTSYRLEPGVSRRQVLVPAITDVLEAYPKE